MHMQYQLTPLDSRRETLSFKDIKPGSQFISNDTRWERYYVFGPIYNNEDYNNNKIYDPSDSAPKGYGKRFIVMNHTSNVQHEGYLLYFPDLDITTSWGIDVVKRCAIPFMPYNKIWNEINA